MLNLTMNDLGRYEAKKNARKKISYYSSLNHPEYII